MQGSRFGVMAGTLSATGNVFASVIQGTAALFLIHQVGHLSPDTLWLIKIFGALYILYLGATLLKVKSFGDTPEDTTYSREAKPLVHLWNGFAFAILNPKALTFFAALFPQFIDGSAISTQILAVVFLPIIVIAFACFMLYVVAGKMLIGLLSRTVHTGKVLGGLIMLAGISLLFS